MVQSRKCHRITYIGLSLAIQLCPEGQRLLKRQMVVERQPVVAQRFSLRRDISSRGRLEQTSQQAQQTGFTDPVGAGQQSCLSRFKGKCQITEQYPLAAHAAYRLGQ